MDAGSTEGTDEGSAAADALRLVHSALPRLGADTGRSEAETIVAALSVLRELREELAGWEPRLIAAARALGVSWNQLAPALGVASRQAAERRYLRLRPAAADEIGTTGDQRVQNERRRRAGDRAVLDWARRHSAVLRQVAARVTELRGDPDLDRSARRSVEEVQRTLALNDAAALLDPLGEASDALLSSHPALARTITDLTEQSDTARQDIRRNHAPGSE
jgi:hypothetical protein